MIKVEAVWLRIEPMDMLAGTDTALARLVQVFGSTASRRYLRQQAIHATEGARA